MRLDPVSDIDLIELQRLSKELLVVMHRANMHNAILADLLDELEQQATTLRRKRFSPSTADQAAPNTQFAS
jgi:hypothetical protein